MQIAQAFKEKKKATTSISSDVAASKFNILNKKYIVERKTDFH